MSKLVTKEHATLIANAVIDKVKNKGYAVESDLGSLAGKDEVDKIDLSSALAQEIDSKLDAADILTYTVKKQTTADTGYSSTYQLYSVSADETPIETPVGAKINIPKDMVVESGTVGVVTVADEPYEGAVVGDKYIDLVIANADDDHIYIPVGDLVDIYEAGNGIDITNNVVSVIVDSNNANGLGVSANGISVSVATPSVSGVGGTGGVMSPTDKEKLDNADFVPYTEGNGIDITNHVISTNVVTANGLSVNVNGVAMSTVQASVNGVGGANGAMSGSDKEKLDDVEITTASELADLIAGLEDLDDKPVSLTALKFSNDDNFTLSVAKPGWDGIIEYSLDDGDTWTTWNGSQLSGDENNDIYVRGTGNSVITGDYDNRFTFTGKYCTGNIETLLDYQTVENNEHPTMGWSCYRSMFARCTSLTTPPELPAIETKPECYYGMFSNCTSLITLPELPATWLTDGCYGFMFKGCTSLTTTPSLPVTRLDKNCYASMFEGCVALTTLPLLPAIRLNETCYDGMFKNCTNIKISQNQINEYQYEFRIPTSETGIDAEDALSSMFYNTGGTFTGTPEINTTYYTTNQPV